MLLYLAPQAYLPWLLVKTLTICAQHKHCIVFQELQCLPCSQFLSRNSQIRIIARRIVCSGCPDGCNNLPKQPLCKGKAIK